MAQDSFGFGDFFGKNMGFGMPGIVTPTLDVEELEKKIKDLKAVEVWLKMNLSMLQMTIQGLEVQRNTLSSLKAFGKVLSDAVPTFGKTDEADPSESGKAASPKTEAPQADKTPSVTPETETGAAAPVWPWDVAAQAMANLQQQVQDKIHEFSAAKETSKDAASTPASADKPATGKKPAAKAKSGTAQVKKPASGVKKATTPQAGKAK